MLPWRALAGERPDPYHVWLSEIMLQQTTVAAVGPYFSKFLARWPTLRDLAKASRDEVMQMWAGLGYYRRARFLHECAQTLGRAYDGKFPTTEEALRKLPGCGPYTAAAIAAIAFDQRANVVDGNVERVMARLFAVKTPMPAGKPTLKKHAATLLPAKRHGDYAQALMDLGATVCTPRSPKCDLCPLAADCKARELGIAESLPRRGAVKAKPVRRAIAFVLTDAKGRIFLRQRPEKGLLASMMEIPSSVWNEGPMPTLVVAQKEAPVPARWTLLRGLVRHSFTHFDLELAVAVATSSRKVKGRYVDPADLRAEALPSVMRKIIRFSRGDT